MAVMATRLAAAAEFKWIDQAPEPPVESARQLQSRLDQLRKDVWDMYSRPYTREPDVRGHTFRQDINQWLLPQADLSRLETLQANASAQQGAPLHATLAEATGLMQQQAYRGNLINNYWLQTTRIAEQEKVFDSLESRMPQEARKGHSAAVTAALNNASTQLSAALEVSGISAAEQLANSQKVMVAVDSVFNAYADERAQLGKAIGVAERARGIGPVTLLNTAACPTTAASTSGRPTPMVAGGAPDVEDMYPNDLRRRGLGGTVRIDVTVSATGCAEKVELVATAGVDELDQAALHWALAAPYRPAEHNGQPVEAVLHMGVRFQSSP
jgi:TonB family protein